MRLENEANVAIGYHAIWGQDLNGMKVEVETDIQTLIIIMIIVRRRKYLIHSQLLIEDLQYRSKCLVSKRASNIY